MNKIELMCIGDLKFKGLKEVEKNYIKKINYFTTFGVRNLKDIDIRDEEAKKKKEGRLMEDALDAKDWVIALDQYGKKMDSIKFSQLLSDKIESHPYRIVFLIGGHAGIAKELDNRIHQKISFSDLTFAHDVFRVVFLEQLYRAFTISKGMTYHR